MLLREMTRNGSSMLYLLFCLTFLQNTLGRPCPEKCMCTPWTDIVACSSGNFERIPTDIPEKTIELRLNGNHFVNPELQPANFSRLHQLQKLFLSDCGVEQIRAGTFSSLSQLKQLDLSKNRLKHIASGAFRGLSLNELFLSDNPHVQLSTDAFDGLSAKGVMLSNCYLRSLSPRLLQPLQNSLEVLWLEKNQLQKLSPELNGIFASLRHVRLGQNPLHCSCNLRWLQNLVTKQLNIFEGGGLPKCASPATAQGQNLGNLDPRIMSCNVPLMRDVHVIFDSENVTLSFAAESRPRPAMRLDTPAGSTITNSKQIGEKMSQLELVLNRKSPDSRGIYYATASNLDGNTSFSLTVDWPHANQISSTTSTVKRTQKQANPIAPCTTLRPSSTFATKSAEKVKCSEGLARGPRRYTLAQLIGAAAGAFCFALILALLIAFCMYRYISGTQRKREAAAVCQAKENLYTMVSQEQRQHFLQEERQRLCARSEGSSGALSDPLSERRLLAGEALPAGSESLHYAAGRKDPQYHAGLRHSASLRETGHYGPGRRGGPYAVHVDPYALTRLLPSIPPPAEPNASGYPSGPPYYRDPQYSDQYNTDRLQYTNAEHSDLDHGYGHGLPYQPQTFSSRNPS